MSIFNLLQLFVVASALVVPQEASDSVDKRSNANVISADLTLYSGRYWTTVRVGSQGTPFSLELDSGSGETWVPNNDGWPYQSTSLVNLTTPFDVTYYASLPLRGYYVKDSFQFDSGTTKDFQFGVVNNSPRKGLIGLSRWTGKYKTLPYHLKESGQVKRNVASIYYSAAKDKGKLIFGGYDKAKIDSEWDVHSDPTTYKVPLVKATINGVDHYVEGGPKEIVVDTGAGFSYIPKAIVEPIASLYNAKKQGIMYKIDCQQPEGQFQVTIGNLTFDYLLQDFVYFNEDRTVCYLGAIASEEYNNLTLIGSALLNRAVTLFDYDNNVVKLAKFKDTTEENIVAEE